MLLSFDSSEVAEVSLARAATNIIFVATNTTKDNSFVAASILFSVATNDVFRVLVTKIILVVAPANGTEEGALPSTPEVAYRETEFTSSLQVGTVSQGKARFHRWRRRLEAMHRELNAC